jgi:phospholipid-binding lipoprotein MlaA
MIKRTATIFFLFGLLCLIAYIAPGFSFALDAELNIRSTAFEDEDDFKLDDDWDIDDEPLLVYDPYEKYNRFMFNTNDKLYQFVLIPLSKGYDFLVPRKIQGSANNFIRFASTPKRFFNNLLQLKIKSSVTEFGRFLINASIGIGGLFDPADRVFGLKQQSEDFGQTLGHYGLGAGPYIIWPVIGPSTPRETLGVGVDSFLSPFKWLSMYDVEPEDTFKAIRYIKRVNNYTYLVRDSYGRLVESAIDPYTALQNAFIQNRNKQISE